MQETFLKSGTHVITEDLTLTNFSWKINSVNYNWVNRSASIEVLIWESKFVHSRSFTFECESEWDKAKCLEKIRSLTQFS